MTQEVPDAAVADSLSNSVISPLRTQYLEYERRYQLYVARYGATHLAVINIQTQMTELRRSMAAELNRIAESYKSNYEIAKAAEESLEKSLAQQVAGAQLSHQERLGLDELESKAKVYHAAHDGFLQQFMEITQQQSLPITEARVISAATAPGGASSPRTSRILFMTVAFGMMLGFAAAYLRDTIDNVFRTPKQVKQILKTNCLTILPILKKAISSDAAAPDTQNPAPKYGGLVREIKRDTVGPFRHVIDEPLSAFAEGIRAVKVATDISRAIKQNKVIGITSSLPHEGKSVVATNFAQLIAQGGSKVILIDGDLRNPTLTRKLVSKPDVGLLQVIGRKCELRQAIYFDSQTGLAFLPAVIESRLAHSSEILASEAFGHLIDGLRETFDYIIIDFPPLAPVVDVRATTNIVDSYVFVVEWGRTRIKMVQRQLDSAPEICDRLLGVVLNKADTKMLNRYEDYYGSYYYKKDYYSAYGYTA
jgi:succinoglycan biosynthesis transport protein ExoP